MTAKAVPFPYVKPEHMQHSVIEKDKIEVGFTDKYKMKMEGRGINRARYAKNYQNAMGICGKCENVVKSKLGTTTGQHCKLRFCNK